MAVNPADKLASDILYLTIKISRLGRKFIGEDMKPQAMCWPEAYFLEVRTGI